MKVRWIVIASAATLLLGGEVWLLVASPQNSKHQPTLPTSPLAQATQPPPSAAAKRAVVAPTIGVPTATPAIITVNTPITVTVTAQINPAPLAGGVNLLRLGATGTQPTILGVMHDDGLNGDAVAGDGIYTLAVNFDESSAGQIQVQVSAAFKGFVKRVSSNTIAIPVWQRYTNPSLGVAFDYPPSWVPNNTADSIYFTAADVEVLDVSVVSETIASLLQIAGMDITNNQCPALDTNNQPVDHIISASAAGVLYVLSCSATTEYYSYVFVNTAGRVTKITYHDDFDDSAPENIKVFRLQQIISTLP